MPTPGRTANQPSPAARAARALLRALCVAVVLAAVAARAEAPSPEITLDQTVAQALTANLATRVAGEETAAARARLRAQQTAFLPTVSTRYGYTRHEEPLFSPDPRLGLVQPEEQYQWVTSVTQPLFTGFALTNQYRLARLGLDAARLKAALVRRDTVFEAKRAYFNLLKAGKLEAVAAEAVAMLTAQSEVAASYHAVGLTPYNDLLKTRVALANARQDQVAAANQQAAARTHFNLLLRRPLDAAVVPRDMLDAPLLALSLTESLAQATTGRVELAVAELEVEMADRQVSLNRQEWFPRVQLQGNYYRQGTDWQVDGGPGIGDESFWDVQAQASWDLWQWGRTYHGVSESKSRLAQARLNRTQLEDTIAEQVTQAWLKADETRRNIVTVEAAVDQAREAYRISEAMFKEQMATATDVLDARTQLSETLTRYYSALYDCQIALAALDRAMGRPGTTLDEVP